MRKGFIVDGADLHKIAELLHKKLAFLECIKIRERVRKDARLLKHGVGFSGEVDHLINKNWRLVGHLSQEAIENGECTPDAYGLLARAYYVVGEYEQALNVIEECTSSTTIDPGHQLHTLCDLASLELTGHLSPLYENAHLNTGVVSIVDYPQFATWADTVDAKKIGIYTGEVSVHGINRYSVDGVEIELDNTMKSTPLWAARINHLEVLGGYVPQAKGCGLYDNDMAQVLLNLPPIRSVSKTRIAYDLGCKRHHFAGKYIVTTATDNYYANYFHCICQICARLVVALQQEDLRDCGVLLPESTPAWVLRFLAIFGVPSDRISHMPEDGISVVEEAFVLPMKWDVCPYEIANLRRTIFQGDPGPRGTGRFYLLRRNAKFFTRSLVNEQDFVDVCQARGFQILDPLEFSPEEQVALFRTAGVIVTSASSAYTNMLYAPPGAEVVLIAPRLFWGMLSSDLATACGHRLTAIFGEFAAGDLNVSSANNPYFASPQDLEKVLEMIL